MAEYFKNVKKIQYEGKDSKNPLAFKYYNPEEKVGDKTMEEHLRFCVSYWHTFTGNGADPFGEPTLVRPWDRFKGMDLAKARVEASFEFYEKLGVPFFVFHDRDMAPEGETLRETNKNLDEIVALVKEYMKTSKAKVIWNTVALFKHPRFVHGAATSPSADVFAYAAAQVKKGLDVAKELNTTGFTMWGGREGYETLLNTDLALELDNLARFLQMTVNYAKEIGFTGHLYLEPKPKEPTKHQYDFDVATTIAFLRKYGLEKHFKFNIEANHATLAGHTFQHELRVARINGMFGSIDANQGDLLLGWDTDEFPTDIYETTLAMYEVLLNGGLGDGVLNFDAKVRRASLDPEDLFHAHIAGMDAFARGLKVAHKLLEDRVFEDFIAHRYRSYKEGIGLDIVTGKADFRSLEAYVLDKKDFELESGRQEYLKSVLNQYILEVE
ncbi:xylose isomerase [Thermoflavimicrobium dichotomicum]|uniref:Xylose isomerase n=1 Tax=Thermoflavimicrobium dichotomicum TaxID=46223 RepID=A0A1I3VC14_9BACL|nr:xylose isomerase [Thermoflavimicrobium dichotomicum]SFJ91681.1 xylose isomerase [Thermoflavimicrobium dichotomicum]